MTCLISYKERIFLKSKEEHEVHLKLVLESLRKEKLYAKFSKLGGALSRKEGVKSIRVRGMILAAQSEAFKQENVLLVGSIMDEAHASRYLVHPRADKTYYILEDMYCLRYLSENEIEPPWILSLNFQGQSNNSKEWNSSDDQLRLRWMIYLMVLADAAECVRDAIGFEYCLASLSGWTKSPVLWAEIGESSLTGLELVQETTDKVVLVKEKPKAARDHQKSYVDYRRPFEILERISPVAYSLRFLEFSLLLTPLCCDDIHDVTPRVSALAGYDTDLVPLLAKEHVSNTLGYESSIFVELRSYHNLWDIIVDGDLQEEAAPAGEQSGPPAPKTAKQLTAKRNQERVKSILLLAIPDEYLLKFHNVPDAKSLWAAIKSRFGGNEESKKM
ncbi:hypothetical protein Tco_1506263 [Tanacetum coccineum]